MQITTNTALTMLAGLTAMAASVTAGPAVTPEIPEGVEAPDVLKLLIEDMRDAKRALKKERKTRTEAGSLFGELSEASIFFEENTTDGDLGIQFFMDGDAWDHVIIFDPTWRRFVDVKVRGRLRGIGLTEVFSESAEPSYDDLPRDEFLETFQEGDYYFFGYTLEGDWLAGISELTKTLVDPVAFTFPMEDDEVDATQPMTITWDAAGAPKGTSIVGYHLVVEKDEDDERGRVLAVDMNPGDTSFTVAPGFLEPGKDYKAEIIVEEESGNKSITEVPFSTAGGDDEGDGDKD